MTTQGNDPHAELRERAHEDVLANLMLTVTQKLTPGTFAICIFDRDDPNTPDPFLSEVNDDGYVCAVIKLDKMIEAFPSMEMPAPGLDLRWSPRDRKWKNKDGQVIKPGHSVHFPFAHLSEKLKEELEPGTFIVITFIQGSVAVFHAVLEAFEPESAPEPV